MLKIKFDTDQYNKLAYNSVNYACGRSSFIVGVVLRIVRDNMNCLSFSMINEIVKLIVDRNFGASELTSIGHVDDWRILARDLLDIDNGDLPNEVELSFQSKDDLRLLVLTSFRSNLYYLENDIVPDYNWILTGYSNYMNKNWYSSFVGDIREAKYFGGDPSLYDDILEFIYDTAKSN